MKEKTLLRIAIITSLVCLPVLYFLSSTNTILPSSLDDPGFKQDMMVELNGIVHAVKTYGDVTSFRLTHPAETDVVVFGNTSIPAGATVAVIGRLDATGKQLVAEEIKVR